MMATEKKEQEVQEGESLTAKLVAALRSKAHEVGGENAKITYEIAELEHRCNDLTGAITDLKLRLEGTEAELRSARRKHGDLRQSLSFLVDWIESIEKGQRDGKQNGA